MKKGDTVKYKDKATLEWLSHGIFIEEKGYRYLIENVFGKTEIVDEIELFRKEPEQQLPEI